MNTILPLDRKSVLAQINQPEGGDPQQVWDNAVPCLVVDSVLPKSDVLYGCAAWEPLGKGHARGVVEYVVGELDGREAVVGPNEVPEYSEPIRREICGLKVCHLGTTDGKVRDDVIFAVHRPKHF